MVNKNVNKGTRPRVWVNTILLVVVAIMFGCLTCRGVAQIQTAAQNFRSLSDAPHLCFEEEIKGEDGTLTITGGYLCSSDYDVATNSGTAVEGSTESALFLYDTLMFSSLLRSDDLVVLVSTIGSMLSLASLVGAVVYFNHNRS